MTNADVAVSDNFKKKQLLNSNIYLLLFSK